LGGSKSTFAFGNGGRPLKEEVDLVDDVEDVESFLKTVGDGGRNVLEVSSEATLLLEMDRLLP